MGGGLIALHIVVCTYPADTYTLLTGHCNAYHSMPLFIFFSKIMGIVHFSLRLYILSRKYFNGICIFINTHLTVCTV